jgi:hypothetical protein
MLVFSPFLIPIVIFVHLITSLVLTVAFFLLLITSRLVKALRIIFIVLFLTFYLVLISQGSAFFKALFIVFLNRTSVDHIPIGSRKLSLSIHRTWDSHTMQPIAGFVSAGRCFLHFFLSGITID